MTTTRRAVVVGLGLTALSGATVAEETPLITFGLITDTHLCDLPDQSDKISPGADHKYYSEAAAKIAVFARRMAEDKAAFIAELGDLVDAPVHAKAMPFAERRAAMQGFLHRAVEAFSAYPGPRYHILGNHDTLHLTKDDVAALLPNPGKTAGRHSYSWDAGGVHFVALDADYRGDGRAYSGEPEDGGYDWRDANLPDGELAWLRADLAAATLPVIVFSHQLLNPQDRIKPGFNTGVIIRNADAVRAILEDSGKVLAVFSGHYHAGGYQQVGGIHYIVLQANVAYGPDLSHHNQFATVGVHRTAEGAYRLHVIGAGQQRTHVLDALPPGIRG